jgi:hypothetical protein
MSAATLKPILLECLLSLSNVCAFSVAVDVNSNALDFYFLIWSLSRLCCVCSGFNVVAA